MNLISKWTLGGGLAVAALVAAFSLFGSMANAGLADGGELITGDLECDKSAFHPDLEFFGGGDDDGVLDVIQGQVIAFDVDCEVNFPALDEGDEILIGDIAINDQLPDNFDIEFATCEVETVFALRLGFEEIEVAYPAQVSGQNVTCVFPSPFTEICVEVGEDDDDIAVATFGNQEEICFPAFPVEVEMTIEGSFNEAPCGEIKNIAVAEMGGDTETVAAVIFLECFDVSVTKTASTVTDSTGATVLAGGTIIYVIEVCNVAPGPSLVNNVFFFDQLPLGTLFQSSASADFDLAFDATSSQILGTTDQLQAGECGSAVITVTVAKDAPCGTPFTNLAVAGSATGIISDFPFDPSNFVVDEDADPSNNQATTTTTVVCPDEDEDGKDDDDGGGPSVGTGDTGLLTGDSAVAAWQLGLLSLLIVGSLSGAYVAARRVR